GWRARRARQGVLLGRRAGDRWDTYPGGAMKRFAIAWAAGAGLLAAGFFLTGATSRADIEKEMYDALANIAKALQDGDQARATKLAQAYGKKIKDEDLGELMHSFKMRK